MRDPLDGNPSGPTAVYEQRPQSGTTDPEAVAAAAADSAGSLGASVMLLLAVFALDCWRAVQQSITHDEAQAGARALLASAAGGPLLGDDPHVVHSVLARLCVEAAGPQEWVLRLPSLLGAMLFLVGGLSVCRLAFGRGWLAFLGFALLALDPLLLDLQSLGRGDGLSLGLLLWGMLHVLLFAKGSSTGSSVNFGPVHAIAGSLALGLAAASCPTVAPVALSLLVVVAIAILAQRRRLPGGASAGGRIGLDLAGLLLTGPLMAALLLWLPLRGAQAEAVFAGSADSHVAGYALADASLAHQRNAWPVAPDGPLHAPARDAVLFGLGPLLALAMLLRLAFALRRWAGATSLAELDHFARFHVLIGGGWLLGGALTVAGHVALGLPWPDARSGAPLLALALLCATGLAAEGWRRGRAWRLLALPPLAALVALLLQFASQVQASEYYLWKQDAGARRVFEQIVKCQDRNPRVTVRVAASEELQPALDYYRTTRHAGWMEPVRAGVDSAGMPADFLVLTQQAAVSGASKFSAYSTVWTDPAETVLLEASRD